MVDHQNRSLWGVLGQNWYLRSVVRSQFCVGVILKIFVHLLLWKDIRLFYLAGKQAFMESIRGLQGFRTPKLNLVVLRSPKGISLESSRANFNCEYVEIWSYSFESLCLLWPVFRIVSTTCWWRIYTVLISLSNTAVSTKLEWRVVRDLKLKTAKRSQRLSNFYK